MINRRSLMGSLAAAGAALQAAHAVAAGRPASAPAQASAAAEALKGRIIYKGDDAYEITREFSVWNARKPKRYPEAIVMAESVEDVQNAVKLARAKGWKVGVRSGGHSWYAAHTRNRAILINLANLKEMKIDAAAKIAVCSPSTEGQNLNTELQDKYGLMFPSAHGAGVAVGGFVMCGGHGWNAREWGLGCLQLNAVDVVTATGELLHCNADQNADLWWAARGAGPGFPGAAVRYYLQCYDDPTHKKGAHYEFPIEVYEPLVKWLRDNTESFPKKLEVVLLAKQVDDALLLLVNATAFGYSDAESDALLSHMDSCPVLDQATVKKVGFKAEVPWRTESPTDSNPTGYRYALDNSWTSAPSEVMVPALKELFTTPFPCPKAYIFLQCWGPPQPTPNAAYSVQGDIYVSPVAVYEDEADDARMEHWVDSAMEKISAISLGGQMNDENMAHHPQRYLSETAAKRLELVRAKYDPHHTFVGFLTAKDETKA